MSDPAEVLSREDLAELRHQLRTPLNQIIGYSEILREDLKQAVPPLASIQQRAREMVDLVRQWLSPSTGEVNGDRVQQLRTQLNEPVYAVIRDVGVLTQQVEDDQVADVLRISAAAADLLAFVHGQSLRKGAQVAVVKAETRPLAALRGHLLVVDDLEANREMLGRQLERLGCTIESAEDGREALSKLGRTHFDLVLLDVMMPGLNGLEVLDVMKASDRLREVPVVMISALDELDGVARCIEHGAEDYLFKPFEPVLLRARISATLERARFRDQERARTRELEQAGRELKASNEELQRFAYAVSHDLQEPLRMVSSYLQLLIRHSAGRLDQDSAEFVNYALDGARRMRSLIDDLLTYAQVTAAHQSFDDVATEAVLADTLANLQNLVAETRAAITHDALPNVPGDKAQFTQLFQNLIGNAIKYRRPDVAPCVHVSAVHAGPFWRFSVRDNGVGILPEYREAVFEVFRRLHGREVPGTGLGLAICRRIVERLGGRIGVDSQPGQGSTFWFTVPAGASEQPGPATNAQSSGSNA